MRTTAVFNCVLLLMFHAGARGQNAQPATGPSGSTAASDPTELLRTAATLNRLDYPGAQPWHLKAAYEVLDSEGHKADRGVFEVYWAAPNKFKQSFQSKNFSQTDYMTEKGLLRVGDKRDPSGPERVVAARIWNRLPSDALLARTSQQLFLPVVDKHPLRCVALDRKPPAPTNANMVMPTYCVDVERPALRRERYIGVVSSELSGETIFNDTTEFHGHLVAKEIHVTHYDKPYINIRIEALEDIASVDDAAFQPPPNAEPVGTPRPVVPDAEMRLRLVQYKDPGFAQMLRDDVDQRVVLSVVVGQDGSVTSVRAVGGWQVLQQLVSKAVMQSAYRPYLVAGKPVEVETEVVQTFQTTRH